MNVMWLKVWADHQMTRSDFSWPDISDMIRVEILSQVVWSCFWFPYTAHVAQKHEGFSISWAYVAPCSYFKWHVWALISFDFNILSSVLISCFLPVSCPVCVPHVTVSSASMTERENMGSPLPCLHVKSLVKTLSWTL